MRLHEFRIGETFYFFEQKFRCTEIGSRTVLGIELTGYTDVFRFEDGREEVIGHITEEEAEKRGQFSGPPYGVCERVFDEVDLPACAYDKNQNGTHCDLGFGQWVRVGEGKSRHKEWRPKSVVRTKKRAPEHLELMRQLDQESDENTRMEIIRRINEVRNSG